MTPDNAARTTIHVDPRKAAALQALVNTMDEVAVRYGRPYADAVLAAMTGILDEAGADAEQAFTEEAVRARIPADVRAAGLERYFEWKRRQQRAT